VAGNYDSTTATDYKHCGCRYENPRQETLAHLSYEWTKAHVTPVTKRYLAGLPFRIDLIPRGGHIAGAPRVVLVHGTPTLNTLYWTYDRPDAFFQQMADLAGLRPGDTVAFGHTHQLWYRTLNEIHFVNAGSAGRPKDGDWRVGYALLSVEDGVTIELVRVEYDVERAMKAIRESELPDDFAEHLRTGGTSGAEQEYRTVSD
jgi:diadenosine tetraphosphatase ApaH/serine/threonine PP2A family protein phosphatase